MELRARSGSHGESLMVSWRLRDLLNSNLRAWLMMVVSYGPKLFFVHSDIINDDCNQAK